MVIISFFDLLLSLEFLRCSTFLIWDLHVFPPVSGVVKHPAGADLALASHCGHTPLQP